MKKTPAKKTPAKKRVTVGDETKEFNKIMKQAHETIQTAKNNKIRNKTMLNKIKWFTAKIINKIDSMFNKIGFHYVGYKVYINAIMRDIKQLKKDINSIEDVDANSIKDDVLYEVEYKIDDVQSDLDDLRRSYENDDNDDVSDDIKTLDKRVKLLEGLAFTGDDIESVVNESLMVEFATYLANMLDVESDDYYNIRRDLIIALTDCNKYNINITLNKEVK